MSTHPDTVMPLFRQASLTFHEHRHAHYCLNDFRAAADAFRRGLELDPTNTNLKAGLQSAEARIPKDDDEMPPLESLDTSSSRDTGAGEGAGAGGLADMLRGMGGGGGGGMPDLTGLMNNPMMAQMAQQMMANGGLERLMQNPSVADMVCGKLSYLDSNDLPELCSSRR